MQMTERYCRGRLAANQAFECFDVRIGPNVLVVRLWVGMHD